VSSRAAEEHRLRTDPLAHATVVALGAAALVALGLALIGFWLAIASELGDERSDFFDLEAQGMSPESLRRQLRARAAILVAVGICGGIALAALLSQLVVSLVQIAATTGVPEPPLRLDPAWLACGLAIVAFAAAALLIVEASSRAAFRGARPQRASWSLE
jgi:ABC-type antimicrobial peptide transport system permease subunit